MAGTPFVHLAPRIAANRIALDRRQHYIASMKYARRLAFVASVAVMGGSALADQQADVEHSFMMVPIDFDVAHAVLLDRCGERYPATVSTLRAAMSAWRSENHAAQLELQDYLRTGSQMSAEAFDAKSRQATLAYANEFRGLGDRQLGEFCAHYADVSLRLTPLRFSEILATVRELRPAPR